MIVTKQDLYKPYALARRYHPLAWPTASGPSPNHHLPDTSCGDRRNVGCFTHHQQIFSRQEAVAPDDKSVTLFAFHDLSFV